MKLFSDRSAQLREIERKYAENLEEKIICGNCHHKFSKYLTICPNCLYGLEKVKTMVKLTKEQIAFRTEFNKLCEKYYNEFDSYNEVLAIVKDVMEQYT